tara:strand:- start:168 stop:983 length:816 start_codon:yes stop_codon:yes gene_type:complete
MRYNAIFSSALIFAAAAFPVSAQETSTHQKPQSPSSEVEVQPLPIVVIGEQEKERRVIVGSRIPRKPIFEDGPIATSTGIRGLTPGSGMDPAGKYTRIVKRTECVAADERIGKSVACILLAAKEASENEDWLLVRGMLVPVAGNAEFSSAERRAASEVLFLSARSSGDTLARIEALELLVASGALSTSETGNALRSLSSLASKTGDRAAALEYLNEAIRVDPSDHQALANLAILQRASGDLAAAAMMRCAILAAEKAGRTVPQSWLSFVGD